MSKFREERYKSIGVLKYRWSSSNDERVRDRHRELNGKIFEWTNPPISGANGERQHAGEPFGCRCVAVAIVD
jgi:SPP1 gp7 family putative phage head morphogenesis protein